MCYGYMDTKETSDTPSDSYHLSLPELLEEKLRSIEEQVALVGSAAVGYWATHKHSEETEKQKNAATNEFNHSSRT